MTKQPPQTRAADWPPCVIEAQRPATSRLSHALRQQHALGQLVEAARSGIGGQRHSTSPATCSSSGQPLTPIVSAKLGAAEHVVAAQHVLADQAARLADADLRRDLEHVGALEAGHARAQEAQVVDAPGAGPRSRRRDSERASVPSTALPSAFFSCVTLTRHSPACFCGRTIAPRRGKRNSPLASASSISAGIVAPGLAGARVVDVADAKHQRRVEQRALRVALLASARRPSAARSPSPEQSMKACARIAHAARLGLDQQRVDASARRASRRRPRARGTAARRRRRAAARRPRT